MARIDRETVQKVLDAADIVEVVSDFVSLKRRGANYMGLCPFHNERTPSFSVSPSKGICKCFSCGKGGSPVNFVMEHEQMSFFEAIRYLAKKYNIEIKERELTPEEQVAQSARESMFAVNDFALRHYEQVLHESREGQELGQTYLRHRGISEEMVRRFRLGFSTEKGDLTETARAKGYAEEWLVKTGLSIKNEQGRVYDRFRGRVIFPVLTVSGKVVAFGGRTLKTEKTTAKYVNSPESDIYQKRRELYGFYQAKNAIAKKDKCILVEGYLDVVSMHQAGVENVVASSGTSLTQEQIVMIRRFTPNITVIYDSDSAGVKASLRSINMLLAAGMSVKILSLPPGEDPDSFAQKNSSSKVEEYLASHEEDFLKFKTAILVRGTENDPMARAKAITNIVGSIASIPDLIARNVYVQECSRAFGLSEKVIAAQVAKFRGQQQPSTFQKSEPQVTTPRVTKKADTRPSAAEQLRDYEMEVVRLGVKYAMLYLCEGMDREGNMTEVTVIEAIMHQLKEQGLELANQDLAHTLEHALEIGQTTFREALSKEQERLTEQMQSDFNTGIKEIAEKGGSVAEITKAEEKLRERLDQSFTEQLDAFSARYVAQALCSDPDDQARHIATELVIERHVLSKLYSKFGPVETEQDRLPDLVQWAVYSLKMAVMRVQLGELREKLRECTGDEGEILEQMKKLEEERNQIAPILGDRVLDPRG